MSSSLQVLKILIGAFQLQKAAASSLGISATSSMFSDFNAYAAKFATEHMKNFSGTRINDLNNIPKMAFLFDFRVLITIMGVVAVILSYYKSQNKWVKTLQINIRPIFFLFTMLKYAFTIVVLFISPAFFFTCSNLLFGISSIYLVLLAIDIITVVILYRKVQLSHCRIDGESVRSIITRYYAAAEKFVKSIGFVKSIIGFVALIVLGTLLKGVMKIPGSQNMAASIGQSGLPQLYRFYIYPIYFSLFQASHYPIFGLLNRTIMALYDSFMPKDVPYIWWIFKGLRFAADSGATLASTALNLYILKNVLLFASDILSKIIPFRPNVSEFEIGGEYHYEHTF